MANSKETKHAIRKEIKILEDRKRIAVNAKRQIDKDLSRLNATIKSLEDDITALQDDLRN